MTAWAKMTPRENIEARARLARNAAARARSQGDQVRAQVQERILSQLCGEAERIAPDLAGEADQ